MKITKENRQGESLSRPLWELTYFWEEENHRLKGTYGRGYLTSQNLRGVPANCTSTNQNIHLSAIFVSLPGPPCPWQPFPHRPQTQWRLLSSGATTRDANSPFPSAVSGGTHKPIPLKFNMDGKKKIGIGRREKGTVDGRNPQPSGMYKTYKTMSIMG